MAMMLVSSMASSGALIEIIAEVTIAVLHVVLNLAADGGATEGGGGDHGVKGRGG